MCFMTKFSFKVPNRCRVSVSYWDKCNLINRKLFLFSPQEFFLLFSCLAETEVILKSCHSSCQPAWAHLGLLNLLADVTWLWQRSRGLEDNEDVLLKKMGSCQGACRALLNKGEAATLSAVTGCPEDSFQTDSEGLLTVVVLLDVQCRGVNSNMLV